MTTLGKREVGTLCSMPYACSYLLEDSTHDSPIVFSSATKLQPAAVLLHTSEDDAALLRLADHLGLIRKEIPPMAVLRESVRSVWDSGTQSLKDYSFC